MVNRQKEIKDVKVDNKVAVINFNQLQDEYNEHKAGLENLQREILEAKKQPILEYVNPSIATSAIVTLLLIGVIVYFVIRKIRARSPRRRRSPVQQEDVPATTTLELVPFQRCAAPNNTHEKPAHIEIGAFKREQLGLENV